MGALLPGMLSAGGCRFALFALQLPVSDWQADCWEKTLPFAVYAIKNTCRTRVGLRKWKFA